MTLKTKQFFPNVGDALYNNNPLEKNEQVIGARYIEPGENAVQCCICKGMFESRCFVQHQKRCKTSHPESQIEPSLRSARALMASSTHGNPLTVNLARVYEKLIHTKTCS